MIFIILGPEADGSHFENAKVAFQKGSGAAAAAEFIEGKHTMEYVDHREKATASV